MKRILPPLMLEYKMIIAGFAVIFSLIGYIIYIKDIFNGKTKPHAYSWLIWAVLGGIAFFAQITNNAGPGSWVVGLAMIVSFFVFLLSLKKGEKEITISDSLSLVGASFALALWYITNNALGSVILATIIEGFAFYPTVRKSFHKPREETALMYGLAGANFGLSIFALETYSMITVLYPAVLVFMNFFLVGVLIIRKSRRTIS